MVCAKRPKNNEAGRAMRRDSYERTWEFLHTIVTVVKTGLVLLPLTPLPRMACFPCLPRLWRRFEFGAVVRQFAGQDRREISRILRVATNGRCLLVRRMWLFLVRPVASARMHWK